ncbi:MAG: hypothetical protein HZA92_13625 [Verrucomicrobia bacterium]|nr:hypothetical protein [Verrucomicrobiota bacterium]
MLTPGEIQHLEAVFNRIQIPLRIAARSEPLAEDFQQLASLPLLLDPARRQGD